MSESSEFPIMSPKDNGGKDWKFSIDGEYRYVTPERLDEAAKEAEVIIANDDHPSSFIHSDWVDLIKRLKDQGENPSLLFEMIKDNFQDGLNHFAKGEMEEAEFRAQVYNQSWDWDYRRYQPYFQLARDLHLPAIAADLNKESQQKFSTEDKPVETYRGTRLVSEVAHQRDVSMTSAIQREREAGKKPFLLVGGAHFGNQVKLLTEQYGVPVNKILMLSEYVDGQHTEGFMEFKSGEGKPTQIHRLRPPEPRR
jgi:uncharacterized iron-regulated protein